MDVIHTLYTQLLVQPAYNALVALYVTLGQQQAGLTFILVGLLGSIPFIPLMIRGYFDKERIKELQPEIEAITAETPNPEQRQQKILKLLRRKQIRFQSESIFLFWQGILLALLYPVLLYHWSTLHPELLYEFTPRPPQLTADFLSTSLVGSSPTLSLIPAILLFFELRQSYREQRFLTSFIDRWYPVILPLFVYFLIFWLPSGLSLVLATSLAVSLYVRFLLDFFTNLRRKRTRNPA